ncbi:hypothetical protein JKP88DRAFT_314314 [Tribonema minus]|uniref:Cyclic nucleotide-binding domain-containing protein n=1 Tax=Tribonema minus TaxID=303371 RepID=A0A835Z0D8_9STRA|nr:hypothetical protein JKP88DRAFT_314314 [Tribonema minus]
MLSYGMSEAGRLSREEEEVAERAAQDAIAALNTQAAQPVVGAAHMTGPYSHLRRAFDSGAAGDASAQPRVFLRRGKGVSRFVLDPNSRPFMVWVIWIFLVTLVVSFLIPVALAIFYATFWLDMIARFNLAVWLPDGAFLTTRRDIAQHYLATWFFWDFMSSMPWEAIVGQDHNDVLRLMKLLRFGRLAQTLSGQQGMLSQYERSRPVSYDPLSLLAQTLSGQQGMLSQYERSRPVNYDAVSLARLAVLLPLVLHIMGCGLYIVASLEHETYDFREANGIEGDSVFEQWVFGIYWAAMTCTTIGYGDVVLVTYAERAYVIICMLVGATCYAYLVGTMIGILATMAKKERERRARLTAVNELMADVKLPPQMQVQVRRFMADVRATRECRLQEHITEVALLSPPFAAALVRHMYRGWLPQKAALLPFAAALVRHMYRGWLPQVWWLHTTDDTFVSRLAIIMKSQSFAPKEPIFKAGNSATAVFVLSTGVLVRFAHGNLLQNGLQNGLQLERCEGGLRGSKFMFGRESLLKSVTTYSYSACAATYVSLWRLDRAPFAALLDEFPRMSRLAALLDEFPRMSDVRLKAASCVVQSDHAHAGDDSRNGACRDVCDSAQRLRDSAQTSETHGTNGAPASNAHHSHSSIALTIGSARSGGGGGGDSDRVAAAATAGTEMQEMASSVAALTAALQSALANAAALSSRIEAAEARAAAAAAAADAHAAAARAADG